MPTFVKEGIVFIKELKIRYRLLAFLNNFNTRQTLKTLNTEKVVPTSTKKNPIIPKMTMTKSKKFHGDVKYQC